MGKFRKGKVHFYTQGEVPPPAGLTDLSGVGGYAFDALFIESFDPLSAVGASVVNTTVQARLVVPQRCVIVKIGVSLVPGAAIVAGDAFNIVKNNVAESGAAGAGQTIQATGNSVFAVDKAIGGLADVSAAGNVFVPDQPEAFYDTGDLLTLRVATSAAVGVHLANLKISMLFAVLDPKLISPKVGDAGSLSGADPNNDF